MIDAIRNSAGERLDFSFERGSEASHSRPDWLVILGHGVTGNMDRPVIVDTARALNAAGFDTLRFSFSGNGGSDGDFRASNITKGVEDLTAVIEVASRSVPSAQIAYVGHSMGAAIGVLVAARDPRIRAMVSLAGMVDTKRFAETEFGTLKANQDCMWEEDTCPLSSEFMHDLCTRVKSVAPAAESIAIPWLLVHGSADDVVLPVDSESIAATKGGGVTVLFVDGADHSFNDPSHKKIATEAVAEWLGHPISNKSDR